jgi:NodT family efflux transporter outer membrane factor (OMF) lipoprotein
MTHGNHALRGLLPALLALSGCAQVFPPPQLPTDPLPAHYRAQAEPTHLPDSAAGQQTLISAHTQTADWWHRYQSAALDALVAEGMAHNQSVAQAQHQLLAAQHALRASQGASDYPQVNASLTPVRQRALNLPIFPEPTSITNIYTAQVSASYTFDFFGQAFQTNRALASQVDQQAWQRQAMRQSVASNIVYGVINAAALQAQRDAMQRQAGLSRQQAEAMLSRQRLGSASQDQVLQLQQQAEADRARVSSLDSQLSSTRHALAILLGRTPEQAPEVIGLTQLHLPAEIPLVVPSQLLQQRPDILAASAAARAAADQAGAARAAMFPSLSLSASLGRSGYNWSDLSSPANLIWGVGASLTQPIFNGGALAARHDQSLELYQVALAQYRQTVLSAFGNVADTLAALEDDAQILQALQQQNQQGQQLWRNSQARYQLGAISRDSSRSAEQASLALEQQYSQALAKRLSDSAALFNAMGGAVSE